MDKCEAGQKLGIQANVVVRIIVDELRTISYYFPVSTFRKVVAMLAARYPNTFLEKDDSDQIITSGNSPLLAKIINHNNYFNRAPNRSNRLNLNIPLNKRRKYKTFERTCKNWQPQEYEIGETKETIKDKKKFLLEISVKKTFTKEEYATIKEYMSQTYAEQRLFLNKADIPSANEVKNEWPFLVHKEFIFDHFTKLTEINIKDYMEKYNEKKSKISHYFQNNKRYVQQEYDKDWSYIDYITKHFKEDTRILCDSFDVSIGNTISYYIFINQFIYYIVKFAFFKYRRRG